nr:hypothetical protein [Thiocapsa sp. KS1]
MDLTKTTEMVKAMAMKTYAAGVVVVTLSGVPVLGGCVSSGGGIGPNSLIVPVTQKGVELAGYGAGAAMGALLGQDEKEEEEAAISGDAILAKADESCVKENLSEADCARLKASAEKMTALAMNVQNLDAMAKESRRQQQAEAMKPQNILLGIGEQVVGHQMMMGRIDMIQGGTGMAVPGL